MDCTKIVNDISEKVYEVIENSEHKITIDDLKIILDSVYRKIYSETLDKRIE